MADALASLSKNEKIGLGVGSALLLGFTLYRYQKQKQQSAADAAAAAAAQAPGTGAGSSDQIDPATGFPYGSIEDASALTAQAGYNSPIGGLGYSDTSYLYGGNPGYPGSGIPITGGYTSNAQWSQAAENYLVQTVGADPNTVGNALGKYITGGTVDDAQTAIINQAIAFNGYPPVSGPEGYPPSIRTGSPTPTTPPPSNGSGTVAVPNTVGQTAGNAHNLIVAAKLTPIDVNWDKGDSTKKVTRQNPPAGTKVTPGSVVDYWHA
jgi:PASTA domain-containing protein